MRRAFAIVNDQRELEPFKDEAMEVAGDLLETTNERSASKVIRILPANLIAKVKLSTTLVTGESRYDNISVASPEEAEAALSGQPLRKPEGPGADVPGPGARPATAATERVGVKTVTP